MEQLTWLPLTKLQPFTSITMLLDAPSHRSKSNPHTRCPKASTTSRAYVISSSDSFVMNRVSLPSALRRTSPSTTGDLRVSACEKLGPTV